MHLNYLYAMLVSQPRGFGPYRLVPNLGSFGALQAQETAISHLSGNYLEYCKIQLDARIT